MEILEEEEPEEPVPEIIEEAIPEPMAENIDIKTNNLKSTEQAMHELLRAVSEPVVHAEPETIP